MAAVAVVVLCSGVALRQAQAQAPSQTPAPATAPAQAAKAPEAEQNPFAPQPAPPLPPGMTGSDTNDPRYKLKPGMYDAGEAADGIEARRIREEA